MRKGLLWMAIGAAVTLACGHPLEEPERELATRQSELDFCTALRPIGATASGGVPRNAIDSDLATRWSASGIGAWLQVDLGAEKNVCGVQIAWYRGDTRAAHFQLLGSTDGVAFHPLFSGDSSGKTTERESYDIADTSLRHLRVVVNGTTVDNLAAITEIAPETCAPLPIDASVPGVVASSNQRWAAAAFDGDPRTHWWAQGPEAWIRVDLGAEQLVQAVDFVFRHGDLRNSRFEVAVSRDDVHYVPVQSFTSGGSGPKRYDLPDTRGRYVKLTVHGTRIDTATKSQGRGEERSARRPLRFTGGQAAISELSIIVPRKCELSTIPERGTWIYWKKTPSLLTTTTLDELQRKGVNLVILGGIQPTLRSDPLFPKIQGFLAQARTRGMRAYASTFEDPSWVNKTEAELRNRLSATVAASRDLFDAFVTDCEPHAVPGANPAVYIPKYLRFSQILSSQARLDGVRLGETIPPWYHQKIKDPAAGNDPRGLDALGSDFVVLMAYTSSSSLFQKMLDGTAYEGAITQTAKPKNVAINVRPGGDPYFAGSEIPDALSMVTAAMERNPTVLGASVFGIEVMLTQPDELYP